MGNCQAVNKATSADGHDDGGSSRKQPPVDVTVTETSIPSSIENDKFQIPIKIFTPTTTTANNITKRAVVFFIHGGIFALGDMHSHPTISHALCQLGLVVVTASFRNGEEAPHKSNVTMRDLNDVVDHCLQTYKDLPFGLVGSSSGGFFAIHLCQTLHSTKQIAFCIPICPVADPFKRASYLRSSISGSAKSDGYNAVHTPEKSKYMLEKQLSFWQSDECMLEARESTKSNTKNVPTLLIIGSADKNVPFDVTNEVQGWATRTVVIGGKGHELCDKIVESGGHYCCYLPDIERFLKHCLREE
mmetsp:Transcript_19275/g.28757  ORF Transcript_19275/g.28757 Transcript_19275/m.28757 type:complete len:302 (+) Transcript_19275:73-978(+)